MSRYKVLKSVGYNIGHSFTSLMNYADDDYVMGHILRLARLTGSDTLSIDFVRGTGQPPELLVAPISDIPAIYTEFFWNLVERHGSERSFVESATLRLHYDLSVQRPIRPSSPLVESRYQCEVHIRDNRGKDYIANFDGWWYPERIEPRPWWKFWTLRSFGKSKT